MEKGHRRVGLSFQIRFVFLNIYRILKEVKIHINKETEGQEEGWTDGQAGRRMYTQTDKLAPLDRSMNKCIKGWMDQ